MTNIKYLNDSSELVHALEVAQTVAQKRSEAASNAGGFRFGFLHRSLSADMLAKMHLTSCVVSFSEHADSLSQWRAYAAGGTGVCIGFKSAFFSKLIDSHPKTSERLMKCLYVDEQKEQFISNLLQHELDRVSGLTDGSEDLPELTSVIGDILGKLVIDGPTVKHQAFHSEHEWRFVMPADEAHRERITPMDWRYRPSKSSIIPYKTVSLSEEGRNNLEIATVHIGPNPHPHLTQRSVEMFLRSNAVTFEKVVSSSAPFRNW